MSTSPPLHSLAQTPWLDAARRDAWLAEAGDWAAAAAPSVLLAFEPLKARPWSFVARVRLAGGVAWFKACGPAARHEVALLRHLAARADCTAHLLAADERRHWMLIADAGEPLRDAGTRETRLAGWLQLLPRYAGLQRACLDDVDTLLDLGLPDRRPACLSALLADLLARPAEWSIASAGAPVAPALCERALHLLPELDRHAARLACAPFAAALDHGDLHAGNVMAHAGETRLVDWGDACVTHPFCSLAVTLPRVLAEWDAQAHPRVAHALREAYLEPWQALSTPAALRRDFHAALWIGRAVRLLDLARMFETADAESRARWLPLIPAAIEDWIACHAFVASHDERLLVAAC